MACFRTGPTLSSTIRNRAAMAGKSIDAATLAEIKLHYCAHELTVAQIGLRYGRSPSGISQLARRNDWPPRLERRALAAARRRERLEAARETMLMCFYNTTGAKLLQMEAALIKGELSSEDYERDVQSLKAAVAKMENVEKVSAAGAQADKEPKPSPAAPDDASESERISREIMERFERIQRRRAAEGAAD
jgi:hypothetical protein